MSLRLAPALLPLALALAAALGGCGASTSASVPAAGAPVRASSGAAAPVTATPPALRRLPARRATVWAVGDGADGGPVARRLARRIGRGAPALFLYLGDVYERGTAAEFATHYGPLYGGFARRTAPTPGNHDHPQRAAGYGPYWQRALGGPVPAYYALRIAGWRVLSLNSEAPHDAASPQLAWLRHQVRGGGSCRIAFWHRPRFSAGSHGDQADVAPLWDAVRGRAALVLGGHEHNSQRLRPIGGTTEIIAGAGGHGDYPLDARDPRLAYAATGTPAALELRLRPGVARLAFLTADGRRLGAHTVRCRPGA